MQRRTFLTGVSTGALGSLVLVGSGAFSRTDSQRRVKLEVAADPDAFLGMDECPGTEYDEFVFIDEQGHLEVNMSTEEEGGGPVPASQVTYFDDVFQVCNFGKDDIRLWIQSADRADLEPDHDGPIVYFYVFDDQGNRQRISAVDGDESDTEEWFVDLPVGECICVGIRTDTRGIQEEQLLEDDEVVIHGTVTD